MHRRPTILQYRPRTSSAADEHSEQELTRRFLEYRPKPVNIEEVIKDSENGMGMMGSSPTARVDTAQEQAMREPLAENPNGRTQSEAAVSSPAEKDRRTDNRQNDVEVDSRDIKGRTALHIAVEQQDKAMLEQLLTRNDVEADSKDDDPGDRRPIGWSPSETSLRGIRCYEVPGTINGVPVDALPDSGSQVDAVSEDFARQHGLRIKATNTQLIPLLGGHEAESVGRTFGDFKFRGDRHVHRREFHVLRKSVYDLVLGKKFLDQTKTLTEFCHRIVERVRPCVQRGSRLFLLDESPKDRLLCTVNGARASAIPDTGSELMVVSRDFANRNNLKVHCGKEYRRPVELINGSTIYTDGMVLNAELQFDVPPTLSREIDCGQYVDYVAGLPSLNSHGRKATAKLTFICDLHVIENLPCDIILSNEFIFENQVFSRLKSLFYSKPANTSLISDMISDDGILFIRLKRSRHKDVLAPQVSPQEGASWEERWEIEEARRNQVQLWITSLGEPLKAVELSNENQKREEWDMNNPRPPPAVIDSTSSNPNLAQTQVPTVP